MKFESYKNIVYAISLMIVVGLIMFSLYNGRVFGEPVMTDMDDHYNANSQQETGTNNVVTAIVFDYRGFDTLGEASVLFAAVLGVGVLFDFTLRSKDNEEE